jgi:hypothetical protein
MSRAVSPGLTAGLDLVWVGDGSWVARDPAVSDDDARRVIALIEHREHHVYVVWVRDRQDVSRYQSLREAVQAVATVCGTVSADAGNAAR